MPLKNFGRYFTRSLKHFPNLQTTCKQFLSPSKPCLGVLHGSMVFINYSPENMSPVFLVPNANHKKSLRCWLVSMFVKA